MIINIRNFGKLADKKFVIIIGIFLLSMGYYLIHRHLTSKIKNNIDNEISIVSPVADIAYEKLKVNLLAQKFTLQNILIIPVSTGETIRINELIIQNCKFEDSIPVNLTMEVNGLFINQNSALIKSFCPYLYDMGYDEINADIKCSYIFKKKENEFRLTSLNLNANNMGNLEFALFLSDFNLDKILSNSENPADFIFSLAGISITGAKLKYEDFSLAKRLISTDLINRTEPLISFIKNITVKLENEISHMGNSPSKQLLISLLNFIKKPDQINIIAAPFHPVPLSRFVFIKSFEDIADLLYIRIEPVNQ